MYIHHRYTTIVHFNNIIILYAQMPKAYKNKKLVTVNFHPNQNSALILINFEL